MACDHANFDDIGRCGLCGDLIYPTPLVDDLTSVWGTVLRLEQWLLARQFRAALQGIPDRDDPAEVPNGNSPVIPGWRERIERMPAHQRPTHEKEVIAAMERGA